MKRGLCACVCAYKQRCGGAADFIVEITAARSQETTSGSLQSTSITPVHHLMLHLLRVDIAVGRSTCD